ncbi:hypothetical protein BO94DRAFT_134513 [Aspergillus sclerotioniger CBS 115572]|uniref:Uncharacterized protein n=1 Tax=Aspergillus sclerotioniger CBS 115572 TaxID=1450535 RepID=A0A317XAU4_9EURO|nr:hypothetical protein BO94DRAFT_134513 [Aspergillus sclerotioniger CBS 115572]PWY95714.1 hypothetical protein BO94DRAFT_134513 [Aspergillus sclerotioniger CBS 115572]
MTYHQPAWARPSIPPLRSLHRPSPIPVSRPRARNSLASSRGQLRPFNSSADASVAFVYFPSASGPRCTNLILTVPVHIIPIPSDILTFIFILALLALPTVAASAAASAPAPTLSPSVGLYRCRSGPRALILCGSLSFFDQYLLSDQRPGSWSISQSPPRLSDPVLQIGVEKH